MICPKCNQADLVDKVSKIYMTAMERKYGARARIKLLPEDGGDSSRLIIESQIGVQRLYLLAKKLIPPSSGKKTIIRLIHPDMVVIVFSLIAPFFIYQIATSQLNILPLTVLVLVGFYIFFFLQRKRLIAKFEAQKLAQKTAEERIQRGIKRWMQLYYCARDDIVFNPLDSEFVPIDLVNGYLMKD